MNNISKIAYPSLETSQYSPEYDTRKWANAMKDIYIIAQKPNSSMEIAIEHVTAGWSQKEKYDFISWMHFYQENAHNKYKTAMNNKKAFNVLSQIANYNIPLDSLRSSLPSVNNEKYTEIPPTRFQIQSEIDKREIIESQRKKLLGRLNSAEKLLLSNEGIQFAGDELNDLLKTIHDLKIKILNANKLSVMSSLFEDIIVKSANIAAINGLKKSASILYKIANTSPSSIHSTTQNTQIQNNIDNNHIPENEIPNLFDEDEKDNSPYKSFLDGVGKLDTNDVDDDDAFIVVEAQSIPSQNIQQPNNKLQLKQEQNKTTTGSDIEDVLDYALQNITISDVIKRLELLSGIFKKREIARQISIIDMMMGQLGISSFFPGLGEAQRSALESNQYCSTRIEDILSKLRGTQIGEQINIEGDDKVDSEEIERLKNKLEYEQKLEDARKEKRKRIENEKIDSTLKRDNNVTELESAVPAIEVSEPQPIVAPQQPSLPTQQKPQMTQNQPSVLQQNKIQ